jgi:acyl carrier protein
MMLLAQVRSLLGQVLQLGRRADQMDEHTALLGAIPELDSMAVINVITALEEHFGISIADDEIDGATFETLGSIARFVDQKLAQ